MPDIFYDILSEEAEIDDGDSYGSQARFFDALNEGTDDYGIQQKLVEDYIPEGSRVLYLGNGSGNLTERLDGKYDLVGLDMSGDMLQISKEKTDAEHIQGDMRSLPLADESFDAAIMLGRSMTHLLEDESVNQMMSEVNRVLEDDGVFLFDNFREYTGDPEEERLGGKGDYHFGRVMVQVDDEVKNYDPEDNTWRWNVEYTVYDRANGEKVTFEDTQRHRGFSPEQIKQSLREHGFTDIEMEGRHAERKQVEDTDNEIISKAAKK